MKASDTPKIDQAWWNKNKPATLKSTGLGKAMAAYQEANAAAKKLAGKNPMAYEDTVAGFGAASKSLDDLDTATDKAIAACNKVLHGDCIAVLNKLSRTVLPAEKQALGRALDAFKQDAGGEAARVKGACQTLLATANKFAAKAEEEMSDVSKLEDDLGEIRDEAGHALQGGTTLDKSRLAEAQRVAGEIKASRDRVADGLAKTRALVQKNFKEVFDPGLAAIEPSLGRIRDSIAMPLDVVEVKAMARLDEAAARAEKARKNIEDMASGAASAQSSYLGMLQDFVERGIQRADAVTGNVRTAGGKLDGANNIILEFNEADDGARDKASLGNATKLLTEGIKEIKLSEGVLKSFKKSLEDFAGKLPPFVEPKSKMFREPLSELIKLNQGAQQDDTELKKLAVKAGKVGQALKDALAA